MAQCILLGCICGPSHTLSGYMLQDPHKPHTDHQEPRRTTQGRICHQKPHRTTLRSSVTHTPTYTHGRAIGPYMPIRKACIAYTYISFMQASHRPYPHYIYIHPPGTPHTASEHAIDLSQRHHGTDAHVHTLKPLEPVLVLPIHAAAIISARITGHRLQLRPWRGGHIYFIFPPWLLQSQSTAKQGPFSPTQFFPKIKKASRFRISQKQKGGRSFDTYHT